MIERLAMACAGVRKAYAIQAGREVCLMLAEGYERQSATVVRRVTKRLREELGSSAEIKVTAVRSRSN
jgi:hypothetical protein